MYTIQGIQWNVSVEGEGDCIVLLHGWGQNQYMMKFIADHFRTNYKVINMDLPGFGESEEPKEIWDVRKYADALYELLTMLGIEKPILIAHSFGARIAIRYTICYPVDKLILTGAAGIKNKRGLMYYLRVYTYKCFKRLHVSTNMGSVDYQNASPIMKGVLVASVEDDLTYCLDHIPCETLLVWGERDMQTPLWMGKKMEQEIPNATLITLPREDHFAYFHQSLRFVGIVEAFIYG